MHKRNQLFYLSLLCPFMSRLTWLFGGGSSGNLSFRGFTIMPYICLLLHTALCIFCWDDQYTEEKEMLRETPSTVSPHTRKAAACEIMVHLTQSVLEAAHSENAFTIKGGSFKKQIWRGKLMAWGHLFHIIFNLWHCITKKHSSGFSSEKFVNGYYQ